MTYIVDEWDDAPAPGVAEEPPDAGKRGTKKKGKRTKEKKKPPPLVFKNVEEFVTDYLAPTIRRKLNGSTATWCPEWWRHEEALQRLAAVWRAWENLRHDPALGLSTWFLHHCDPHMRVLLDPDNGPFAACSKDGHTTRPYPPLPTTPANPALWLSPAFSAEPSSPPDET
ncbi:DUF4913 domain-containing protein [Streptomyces sp. NPDC001492]